VDTKEHNNLIKIVFDGSKHLKHVLSNDQIRNMTMIESRFPLTKLPVCGGCEKLALWGRGGQGYCPSCGTITKSPITYSSYLASGYDVDPTGTTFRSITYQKEMDKRFILPDYGM
jgi:hypothetical protein